MGVCYVLVCVLVCECRMKGERKRFLTTPFLYHTRAFSDLSTTTIAKCSLDNESSEFADLPWGSS